MAANNAELNKLSEKIYELSAQILTGTAHVSKIPDIEKSVSNLQTEVGKIQERRKIEWIVFVAACAIAVAWMGYLTSKLDKIDTSITNLTVDIGILKKTGPEAFSKLLNKIESPNSPADLEKSLSVVRAQIQLNRVEGTKPSSENLAKLGKAVSVAAEKQSDNPKVWETAAELVTFRSDSENGGSHIYENSCIANKGTEVPDLADSILTNPEEKVFTFLRMSNCTLVLDDVNELMRSSDVQRYLRQLAKINGARPGSEQETSILLSNVHVVYRGGSLPPFQKFVFEGCTFEFSPILTTPPTKGRALTNHLLTADLGRTEINLGI